MAKSAGRKTTTKKSTESELKYLCPYCNKEKKRSQFYVSTDPRNAIGITFMCKDCVKKIAFNYLQYNLFFLEDFSIFHNKHLRFLAKDIVEKERQQRADTYTSKHHHGNIPYNSIENTKDKTGHDTVATTIPINTINKVYGIDEAYHSNYRQRDADHQRNSLQPPQAVKVVDTIATSKHEHQRDTNLNHETNVRR